MNDVMRRAPKYVHVNGTQNISANFPGPCLIFDNLCLLEMDI